MDNSRPAASTSLTVVGVHRLGWVVIVSLVGVLSGCSAPPTFSRAGHDHAFDSATVAFSSARDAFARYLLVRDEVTASGVSAEKLRSLVTPRQFEVEQAQLDLLRLGRYTTSGSTTFDTVTLSEQFDYGVGVASITMRLCLDTSQVHTVDYRGWEVPAPALRKLVDVTFVTASTPPFELLLEEVVPCEPATC